jgi:hypothetical protein
MRALAERLEQIFREEGPPGADALREVVTRAVEALRSEPETVRPRDGEGRPGGLVRLERDLPTIIVPDLHARMDFFLRVLAWEDEAGRTAGELMAAGRLQIVCVGDGVHAEGRAALRWVAALEEFQEGFRSHESMDEEMRESLGLMRMVMETKASFPGRFHFLKGNHENITNELGNGNFPFRKFAQEGLMVLAYVRRFYGEEVLGGLSRFEKELPLLAVGRGFLVSHAEPADFYPRERVVGARDDPDVVAGLTWTDNGEAAPGSVQRMLAHYLGEEEAAGGYYFGGHRPVSGGYELRAEGRYVQIHDPDRFVVARVPDSGAILLERDVVVIDGSSAEGA